MQTLLFVLRSKLRQNFDSKSGSQSFISICSFGALIFITLVEGAEMAAIEKESPDSVGCQDFGSIGQCFLQHDP